MQEKGIIPMGVNTLVFLGETATDHMCWSTCINNPFNHPCHALPRMEYYYINLLHKNNTIIHAHETSILKTFEVHDKSFTT